MQGGFLRANAEFVDASFLRWVCRLFASVHPRWEMWCPAQCDCMVWVCNPWSAAVGAGGN